VSDEQRLFRGVQQGDQVALRCLYETYKDDLLTVASCLLVDRNLAEDCVHDVFVSFAAGAARIHLRSTLKGYLVASVANQARGELRRRAHHLSLTGAEDDPKHSAVGANPVVGVEEREETAQLREALAGLPYEQREAITLHLHGELTFREIAQQEGISINTVQSRYRYGIARLRELLAARFET